jgi:hypothetical protein
MMESKCQDFVGPEVLENDASMREVLTTEDLEYLNQSFESREKLVMHEPLPAPSYAIEHVEADEVYEVTTKRGTEAGIQALNRALKVRDKRQLKHDDRADWSDFAGYLNSACILRMLVIYWRYGFFMGTFWGVHFSAKKAGVCTLT